MKRKVLFTAIALLFMLSAGAKTIYLPTTAYRTEGGYESKVNYTYDNNGRILSELRYIKKDGNYILVDSIAREYHKLPNGKYVTVKDVVKRKNILPDSYRDEHTGEPVFTDEYSYEVLSHRNETSAYDSKGMLLWEKSGDQIITETILNANNIRTGVRRYGEDLNYTFDDKGRVLTYAYTYDEYNETRTMSYTWGEDDIITAATGTYKYDDIVENYSYRNITTVLNREYFDTYSLNPLFGGDDYDEGGVGYWNKEPLPFTDIQKYVWDDYTLHQWFFNLDATLDDNTQATIRTIIDDSKGVIAQVVSISGQEVNRTVYEKLANGGSTVYYFEDNNITEIWVKEYNQYGALTKVLRQDGGDASLNEYLYNREYDAQSRPTKTIYANSRGDEFEETYDAWVAVNTENLSSITAPSANVANITAYPNPVVNTLYIKTEDNAAINAALYNLQGQLLLQTNETEIDFSAYPTGVYILNVNGEQIKVVK